MTQEERKQKSIKKIIGIAQKLLRKKRFESKDIDKICKQAGLTRGAFYHHFGSKQRFLLKLLDNWINEISAEISSAEFETYNTIEIFNTIIDRMQPVFEKAGKQLPVFLELYIKSISDENLKSFTSDTYNNFINFFSTLVISGIKKGDLNKTTDPLFTAKILFAITIGLLIQGLLNPVETDWAELAKKSVCILLSQKN